MSNEPTDNEHPVVDWDTIVDDDPVIAEIRRIRYEISAEFGFDLQRHYLGIRVLAWACASKYGNPDNPQALQEAELPELPADLSEVIPNRERFLEDVRSSRRFYGKYEPDLDAYNEDARRRARVLGFPEEAFVVSANDFPPDVDFWEALKRLDEAQESETDSPPDPNRS